MLPSAGSKQLANMFVLSVDGCFCLAATLFFLSHSKGYSCNLVSSSHSHFKVCFDANSSFTQTILLCCSSSSVPALLSILH